MTRQMKFSLVFVSIFFTVVLLFIWSCGAVSAKKHTVDDDDGSADFSKIQDAIDASNHGDIIQVSEGTYLENIVVDKQLTLTGKESDTTIINGGEKGDVVTISYDGILFSGFKVTLSGNGGEDAAIKIKSNDSRVFQNLCDESITGIYLYSKAPSSPIEGIEVSDNVCTGNKWGIQTVNSRDFLLMGNNCTGNSDQGIRLRNSDSSTIRNNDCSFMFTGVYILDSHHVTIANNSCVGNDYYGIYLESVESSLVINNSCRENGGGIYVKELGANHITRNTITSNENGIYFLSTDENTVDENRIESNTNRGIFMRGSQQNTVIRNTITLNPIGVVLNTHLNTDSLENTIQFNEIFDNDNYGMDATGNGDVTIIAEDNFWGHASGPFHKTFNPSGKGDNITRFVDFDPWTDVPEGYVRVTAKIDSIAPDPALVGQEITFQGSILEDRLMESYGWSSSLDGELSNGTDTQLQSDDLTPGIHRIGFQGWDCRGIASIEASRFIVVHSPPTAEILSITPSPGLHTDSIAFNGNGSDDGQITRYSWRTSIGTILYNGTEPSFDLAGMNNGSHTIYLMVQDDNGVWSEEVNTTLFINGKPSALIISVTPNPVLIHEPITFTGLGNDDGSIVDYNWSSNLVGIIYTGPNASFSLPSLSLGNHIITLRVTDDAGVQSDPASMVLAVLAEKTDNDVPLVVITGPEQFTEVSEKFKVTGTASDTDGSVNLVELSIDGGDWQMVQGTDSWTLVLDAGELMKGKHTISVRSFDGTDYSEEATLSVMVVEADDDDESGFIAGFGFLFAAVAMIVSTFLTPRSRRRR